MINPLIQEMMKRDIHFKEKMESLGYTMQPVVAVVDWQRETIYAPNQTVPFTECSGAYLQLLQESKKEKQKRSLLTEKAIAASQCLVEDAPDFGVEKPQVDRSRTSREIFHHIFMYEMLLLNEIEDEVALSLDDRLHLVGQTNLQQGVEDTSKRLVRDYQLEGGFVR